MRLGRDKEAKGAFETVVELDPNSYQAYLCLGMLKHKEGDLEGAVEGYHVALSIEPRDKVATELLDFVLEEKVWYGLEKGSGQAFALGRLGRKCKAEEDGGMGKGKGKGKQRAFEGEDLHSTAAPRNGETGSTGVDS